MLISLRTVIGHSVVTQAGPHTLGHVIEPIIDPARGVVAAFQISGRTVSYLATVDVAGYTGDAVVTTTPDALQPLDELVRLKPLIEQRMRPFKVKVVDESGAVLGQSDDYEFGSNDHRIARLHVRPIWWRRLFASHLIISRERIVSFTDREIIVRYDGSVPDQAPLPAETETAG